MKRPIALACAAALCLVLTTGAGALTVRITPDGSGDLPDIQTALNVCASGDTILVAPGGAIDCRSGSSPLIIGNEIDDNVAPGSYAGGIAVRLDSTPTIATNWIHHNVGYWGGGISVINGGNPTISDNLIENNDAGAEGGGLAVYGEPNPYSGLVARNEIRSNTGLRTAGIVLSGHLDIVVSNNLVIGNLILENGGPICGGIWTHQGATMTIGGNLIGNNIGHGVYCELGVNPLIRQNDIHGHAENYGVLNVDETVMVMAESNFWGANSGPYHPTENPSGVGDWVSDHVDFDPWSVVSGGDTPAVHASPVLHQNHPNPLVVPLRMCPRPGAPVAPPPHHAAYFNSCRRFTPKAGVSTSPQ